MSKNGRGGGKNAKASVAAAASAAAVSCDTTKDDNCKICDEKVVSGEYGLGCEICEKWFHAKCEGMSNEEYEFLEAHKSLHWYCEDCNKSVATTIKLFNSLKQKVDGMEEKLNKICDGILPELLAKSIESQIKDVVDLIDSKVKQVENDVQGIKELVTVSEKKLETAIEAKLVDSVGIIKKDLGPSWASLVSKEVTNQFERVSKDVSTVQSVLDDTRKKAPEERKRESRAHNIIIYRVPESDIRDESVKEDKAFCLELFNTVLCIDTQETEFTMFRLGKREQSSRPLLIKFRERSLKNRIMENLFRLRNSDTKFRNISISHDLTINERAELKVLLEEAKKKQAEESGKFMWRVRGLPGQLKLVRLKKN